MDRRSFLQMAAMLAAAHGVPNPNAALAAVEPSTPLTTQTPCPEVSSGDDLGCAVLKVVGIGRAGCNALEHLVSERLPGLEFVFVDTSTQALKRASSGTYLPLGASGLGSMGQADQARAIALHEYERIADVLRGAHMVFIVAGMGGGTGSGVAPVVAQIAQKMGISNVAVVIYPFEFEGEERRAIADEGIARLAQFVDSPIVLFNDGLSHEFGAHATLLESFAHVDTQVKVAIGSIAHIVNVPGNVGVDFEDVRIVMTNKGHGRLGFATAAGDNRARQATEQAVERPTLGRKNLRLASGVLVIITAGISLRMSEINEVMNTVRDKAGEEAHMMFGTILDQSMADKLRVTVITTGIPT
jgi:cell division protein FtsZ